MSLNHSQNTYYTLSRSGLITNSRIHSIISLTSSLSGTLPFLSSSFSIPHHSDLLVLSQSNYSFAHDQTLTHINCNYHICIYVTQNFKILPPSLSHIILSHCQPPLFMVILLKLFTLPPLPLHSSYSDLHPDSSSFQIPHLPPIYSDIYTIYSFFSSL